MTTHSHTQSTHLCNSSGDQCCLRIVSAAKTICHACCQRNDIFQCSPQLNTQHVRTGIHTERFTHEQILNIFCGLSVCCTCHYRSRNISSYFLRMTRSRQHGCIYLRKYLADNICLDHQCGFFNSFRHADNDLSICHKRLHLPGCASGIYRWNCQHAQIFSNDCLLQTGCILNLFRQDHPRKL